MEFDYVTPEELSSNFQSKADLYSMLKYKYELMVCSVKGRYVLPSYNACPLEFIRQFFSGENSSNSFDDELCEGF